MTESADPTVIPDNHLKNIQDQQTCGDGNCFLYSILGDDVYNDKKRTSLFPHTSTRAARDWLLKIYKENGGTDEDVMRNIKQDGAWVVEDANLIQAIANSLKRRVFVIVRKHSKTEQFSAITSFALPDKDEKPPLFLMHNGWNHWTRGHLVEEKTQQYFKDFVERHPEINVQQQLLSLLELGKIEVENSDVSRKSKLSSKLSVSKRTKQPKFFISVAVSIFIGLILVAVVTIVSTRTTKSVPKTALPTNNTPKFPDLPNQPIPLVPVDNVSSDTQYIILIVLASFVVIEIGFISYSLVNV
jgi:hypothetical protein